ncbi:MAG: hypothetical protein WCF85_07190 [Rhodospirillaceae bacterium]
MALTSALASTTSAATSGLTNFFGGTSSAYSFASDKRGRPLIATIADVNAATKPSDKVTIAAQVMESIRMQADAAIKSGRADRLAEMTTQTEQVMAAVNAITKGQKATTGQTKTGKHDPALSKVLTSLNSVLGSLRALSSRAGHDVSSKTTASVTQLDSDAATLARQAGVTWTSPLSKANLAKSVAHTPRLVDYLV